MDSELKELQPTKALVAAVLLRACDDLKLGRRLAARAQEWFTAHEPARAWSFEWCCAILDLDSAAVRKQCLVPLADVYPPDNSLRELRSGG